MRDYCLKLDETTALAAGVVALKCSGLDDAFFADFIPGQFAHVRVPDSPELLLRRPISIYSVDRAQKSLTLAVQNMGVGTAKLCAMQPGVEIVMNAPLGNGFPWLDMKNVFLVGGGIGSAPLYSIAQAHPEAAFTSFLGFRDSSKVFGVDDFEKLGEVALCTDDGSAGKHGFVTAALRERIIANGAPDVIYACGPKPFVKALSAALDGVSTNTPCFVSLEERMGCGMGACYVCTCAIKDFALGTSVNRRVCADGPVFLLSEVIL